MWSPPNPDFSQDVASTFLIASWHELFYSYTPDSNQPHLNNVASLVEELADVSGRWCREPRFQSHVQKIQKELQFSIEDEDDILAGLPKYRSRAQYLTTSKSPQELLTGCQILMDQHGIYRNSAIQLFSAVVSRLPREKRLAHLNVRRLATLAFQHGKEDIDVWQPLDRNPKREVIEIFSDLVKLSTSGAKQHRCTLAVIGPVSKTNSALRMAGISPIAKSTLPRDYVAGLRDFDDRVIFVSLNVEATSIRNAVATCRKQLGIAAGLVSLYQHAESLQIHPVALVQVDGSNLQFSQTEQAFRRLHPRSRPDADIRQGLELLTKRATVDKRLIGAIELLSIASASSDSRVRFANLWSSIETLCGAHEGETTLERVLSLLVPLIVSRCISRATRYLAIETQKLASLLNTANYGAGFTRSTATYVSPSEMMRTLSSPANSEPICGLLKFAQHPLLRFQLWCAWEVFHNPKSMRAMLSRVQQYLEWHIARIYRARNLLIHQGEESPFLVPLLDNLQTYLSMAVQRLIHELKTHPSWDIRHVIEYWNGRMLHITSFLERCPSELAFDDFIDSKSVERVWAP